MTNLSLTHVGGTSAAARGLVRLVVFLGLFVALTGLLVLLGG